MGHCPKFSPFSILTPPLSCFIIFFLGGKCKIANRQVIKISYSTTPNMSKIIASANSNILTPEETQSKLCNCLQDSPCPMGGKCLEKNIIYHARGMEGNGQNCRNYVGNTSTEFKKRLSGHKHTFKNEQANQTALSNHIHN